MRDAMKAIISLRRSASEPFSTSSLRAILSMVMGFGSPSVRVGKPNQPESDHDRPAGLVDKRALSSGRPTASLRTRRPSRYRLLHHAPGRQPVRPRLARVGKAILQIREDPEESKAERLVQGSYTQP